MKILLIFPSNRSITVSPPLGIGYLASVLCKEGYQVKILDNARESKGIRGVLRAVSDYDPMIIGLSVFTANYRQAKRLIDALHMAFPQKSLVVGGPHITGLPEFSLKDFNVNYGIIGEGEDSCVQLFEALGDDVKANLANINGIIWKENGATFVSKRRDFLQDLDSLPFPAWDLIPPDTYPHNPHQLFYKRFPIAPIITSRGCPYSCKFCASPTTFGRRYRRRSAMNVVDEMEMLHKRFGVKEFHIEDDNFTQNRDHVIAICDEILRRGLNIVWKCPNGLRVDGLDKELLEIMKMAGCYQISLGIESCHQAIIDSMGKAVDLEKYEGILWDIKDAGIELQGLFMFGYPEEIEEWAMDTIDYSLRMPFDLAHFSVFTPLPGSSLFSKYKNLSDIELTQILGNINFFTPTDNKVSGNLKSLQRNAVLKFYLRPRVIGYILSNIKLSQFPLVARAIWKYIT